MSTAHDQEVLRLILNPLIAESKDIKTGTLQPDEEVVDPNWTEARELEVEGVRLAEGEQLPEAIDKLSKAIVLCPQVPSLYNNRAQALRLRGDTAGALVDLDKAITLGKGKGKSVCQALVQRAAIHRLEGRNEQAHADFTSAAALGSEYAKMQLISLNPYAAMCNQMLSKVMEDLRNPNKQGCDK